jgi:hypothetical protein
MRPYPLTTALALVASLVIAGCGGGSDKSGTSTNAATETEATTPATTPTETTATTATTKTTAAGTKPYDIKVLWRVKRGKEKPKTAKVGDTAQAVVRVKGKPPKDAAPLEIAIGRKAGSSVFLRARPTGGKPQTANLKSAGGTIKLEKLHYTCKVPPTTFCPIDSITVNADQWNVKLAKPPTVPVILMLNVAGG